MAENATEIEQKNTDHQSRGGDARARSLTAERRTEIAKAAADARWDEKVPVVTHPGELDLAGIKLPCYVTENKLRLISGRGMQDVLRLVDDAPPASGVKPGSRMTRLMTNKVIAPLIMEGKSPDHFKPIKFRHGHKLINGYKGEVLADICEGMLAARAAGKTTTPRLSLIATQCELLIRSFARVGIIALIDEATGFQYERPRRDLVEQLKKFLAESLVRYASGFPADYYKHLCRLKGVQLRTDMRLPMYFGHLTNDLVFRRIAPGLLKALKDRRAERGKPSHKLYQWTSEDLGYPALMIHLGTVVGLMKIHTDYDAFKHQLDVIAPVFPVVPGLFDDPEDWNSPN